MRRSAGSGTLREASIALSRALPKRVAMSIDDMPARRDPSATAVKLMPSAPHTRPFVVRTTSRTGFPLWYCWPIRAIWDSSSSKEAAARPGSSSARIAATWCLRSWWARATCSMSALADRYWWCWASREAWIEASSRSMALCWMRSNWAKRIA